MPDTPIIGHFYRVVYILALSAMLAVPTSAGAAETAEFNFQRFLGLSSGRYQELKKTLTELADTDSTLARQAKENQLAQEDLEFQARSLEIGVAHAMASSAKGSFLFFPRLEWIRKQLSEWLKTPLKTQIEDARYSAIPAAWDSEANVVLQAQSFGQAEDRLLASRRALAKSILEVVADLSGDAKNAAQSYSAIHDSLCAVAECSQLQGVTKDFVFDVTMETLDMLFGSVFSLATVFTGPQNSLVRAEALVKLQELQRKMDDAGATDFAIAPWMQGGRIRAWATKGWLTKTNSQGLDLSLELGRLIPLPMVGGAFGILGQLHSLNTVSKAMAQQSAIQSSLARIGTLNKLLRNMQRKMDEKMKPLLCQISDGCSISEEKMWQEAVHPLR